MKRITNWHKDGNTDFWLITVAWNWRVKGRNPITWLWTRVVGFRSRPWWNSAGRGIIEIHIWSLITSWCARNNVIEAWDWELQVRTDVMKATGRSSKFCDTIAVSAFKQTVKYTFGPETYVTNDFSIKISDPSIAAICSICYNLLMTSVMLSWHVKNLLWSDDQKWIKTTWNFYYSQNVNWTGLRNIRICPRSLKGSQIRGK